MLAPPPIFFALASLADIKINNVITKPNIFLWFSVIFIPLNLLLTPIRYQIEDFVINHKSNDVFINHIPIPAKNRWLISNTAIKH